MKTKDAEKDGKEEEKIGEGRKKQWLRGSFNGKIVPLCLDMCLLAQEQWKTYFKQFRKRKPMNYKNDDKQPRASVFESLCYKQERNEELEM